MYVMYVHAYLCGHVWGADAEVLTIVVASLLPGFTAYVGEVPLFCEPFSSSFLSADTYASNAWLLMPLSRHRYGARVQPCP